MRLDCITSAPADLSAPDQLQTRRVRAQRPYCPRVSQVKCASGFSELLFRCSWINWTLRPGNRSPFKKHPAEWEADPSFWNDQARRTLEDALKLQPRVHRAKNIILFVGDVSYAYSKLLQLEINSLTMIQLIC
ncbi:hypothetical protein MHYP_G00230630 [Metynnis hypsauchen]